MTNTLRREFASEYMRKTLALGIPIVFQNLISLGLNLLDTLMIGRLGEAQLAAIGAANQIYFVLTVCIFGFLSGAAVYSAQYYGSGQYEKIRKVLGIDYTISFLMAFAVGMLALIFSGFFISIYSSSSDVIDYGKDYIRIACLSYPISALSFSISYNSRAIQRLKAVTAINFSALVINGVLNYVLIFGKMGLPAFGVKGAAIATLIARCYELTALFLYVYNAKNHILKARLGELFSFDRQLTKNVIKTASPVVLTEGSWSICQALVFAAYGLLGTQALAVVQVANVLTELIQSFFFGVGNSTAMIIGESLGQRDKEKAYFFGKLSVLTIMILNIAASLIMIFSGQIVTHLYNFTASTNALLIDALIAMGLMITPKMLGYIFIVGILRAGGDTMYCMVVEMICNIGFMLPMAFIAVKVLGFTLPYAICFVGMAEIVRIIACLPRFFSKKWINIVY